jgi:hypothetical protein
VNLSNGLVHPDETARSFCARFLAAPLARTSYARSFGTLYTAIYWPTLGRMHLRWPHLTWEASFTDFVERSAVVALHGS